MNFLTVILSIGLRLSHIYIRCQFEQGSNTWPLHPDYYSFLAPDIMGNEVHIAAINPYEYEINMTSVAKGTANSIPYTATYSEKETPRAF